MPVAHTTTYHKIRELEDKEHISVYLLQGGQGAGKNGGMAVRLLERAEEGNIFRNTITIMTDTYQNLKDGALSDFKFIFNEWGLNFYSYFNKQEMILTWFDINIQFRYLDNNKPDKGKGARRGILYINEGNRVGWEAVKHYIARSKEVYVDFNPDFEFWAHTELEPKDNCEKIIITYKDNEMCPENEVEYIESRRDNIEWFNVYGLGLTGTYSERRMYLFKEAASIPLNAKRLPNGMDFGSSPDPTIEIEAYLDGVDLYLKEVFCENNLTPEKLKGAERDSIVDYKDRIILKEVKANYAADDFKHDDEYYLNYNKESYKNIQPTLTDNKIKAEIHKLKSHLTIGDSAAKVSLIDLRKHHYNTRGVTKKKNSIVNGINRLKSYNMFIVKGSPNIKKGAESWMRKIDHNGKITPEPDGHEPDGLAAARYIMLAKPLW